MTFKQWKTAVVQVSKRLGCPDDLWGKDDPYELAEIAKPAFKAGQSARAFVEEMFADDIASRAHDAAMEAEALESEDSDA